MDWDIQSSNPVAAALLSKMGYQPEEKVQVKLEFMRMLTRMRLDPARMTLLAGFFETYLKLSTNEERLLENEIRKLNAEEVRKMMELTTSWHEKGREEGRTEGRMEGRMEGRTEGEAEGIIKGKLETARNMIREGLAISLIVKMTGLPEAEIIKLQEEIKASKHYEN